MSVDLSMQALQGSLRDRAAAVLAAGTDLPLHCNGVMAEMEQVASAAPVLDGLSLHRYTRALAVTNATVEFDVADAETCLRRVLSVTALS